jgi:putative hydroxymethylpyrimidine transport system substrate-binding protein
VGEEGRVSGRRIGFALGAVAIVAAAVVVAVLATGGGSTPAGHKVRRVSLMLDYFPNADHAGIYAAKASGAFGRQGLDVAIHTPSDPATPLKLAAADKTDFAISYEPEVLRARDKGANVVAVAALVRTPLTSIISLPRAGIRSPADLRGKTVGTAGIDYQAAYLDAIQPAARLRDVGFDLVPALVSGKVDAVLGAFWNYEGIQLRQKGRHPRVIRIEQAGVPPYDELVVVASEETVRERPRRVTAFLTALDEGSRELARDPGRGIRALLDANRDLDPRLQHASVRATLPYLRPAPGRPYGFMDPGDWVRFTAFMHRHRLIRADSPRGAFTDLLLPPPGPG